MPRNLARFGQVWAAVSSGGILGRATAVRGAHRMGATSRNISLLVVVAAMGIFLALSQVAKGRSFAPDEASTPTPQTTGVAQDAEAISNETGVFQQLG